MSFEHPYNIQKTSERHFMILISVRTSCFWHIFKTFITYKRRQKDILYFESKHKMFLRRLFNIHNVQKTSKKHLVFLLKIGWLYEMSVLWHLRDVSEIFFLLIQHFFFRPKKNYLQICRSKWKMWIISKNLLQWQTHYQASHIATSTIKAR